MRSACSGAAVGGQLVEASGARYLPSAGGGLPATEDGVIVAACGRRPVRLNVLRPPALCGVALLLGVDARDRDATVPGPAIGLDIILGNHAILAA